MSAERLLLAVVIAAPPAALGALLAPPDPYARAILGAGTLVGALPFAYLLAGSRALRRLR